MLEYDALSAIVIAVLEDLKARDILHLDVKQQSDFTDSMIIATGTSNRHVAAIVENVLYRLKQEQQEILGVEGDKQNHWVLIDLGDLVVHVMQAAARRFYGLEQLWSEEDLPLQANP